MGDPWIGRGVAVLLGGALAVQALGEYASPFWGVALAVVLASFLGVLCWCPVVFAAQWRRSEIVLVTLSVLVGAMAGLSGLSSLEPPFLISGVEVEAKVTSWSIDEMSCGHGVVKTASGDRYILTVYPERGGTVTELAQGWQNLRPGTDVRFTAKVEQPQTPRSRNTFDQRLYYATRGYSGKMTAQSDVVLLSQGQAPLVWQIRHEVRQVLDRYWPESGPILEGMLFGDTSRLPEETLERYKTTGVLHAFAASGMNIGFVVALVWVMTFFLPRKVRIFFCLAVIVLYAGLCDFSVSVTRAAILAGGVLLGRLGKGKSGSLRWVIWSALLLFIWNPLFMADVSFWLSFAAVLGLVCLTPKLENLKIFRSWPRFLRQGVCLSLAAQLAVTPVLAATFYRISLVGLFLNVVLAGVFGAVIQIGLLGVMAMALSEAPALPLFQAAIWLVEAMDKLLASFAKISWADMWVLQPGWLFWAAWYGALALWLMDRQRLLFALEAWRRRVLWQLHKWMKVPGRLLRPRLAAEQRVLGKKILLIGAIGVLTLSVLQMAVRPKGLEVIILDVGQGDCLIVRNGDVTVMIDAGPRTDSFDSAERVIVPYLLEHGIKKIDMLFITHDDMDHIGGARYLLSRFPVDAVAVPALGDTLLNEAWQEGLPFEFWPEGPMVTKLAAGDQLSWGDFQAEVLAPTSQPGAEATSNNTSLVLRISYKTWSLLLTGDMEKEEMQSMLERGAEIDATFVKLPHHGSKGSLDEKFFDDLRPEAVFIPVGRNSYGHPSGEVLDYWAARGVPLYRTDVDGSIRLILDQDAQVMLHGK